MEFFLNLFLTLIFQLFYQMHCHILSTNYLRRTKVCMITRANRSKESEITMYQYNLRDLK